VVSGDNLYGGSHRLMTRVFAGYGLDFSFVDTRDVRNVERALTPATKLIYCETPTNPMMFLTDLRRSRIWRQPAGSIHDGQHLRDAGLSAPLELRLRGGTALPPRI
jgi:hypothetical protein